MSGRRVACRFAVLFVATSTLLALEGSAGAAREPAPVVLVTFPCEEGNFLCPSFARALRTTRMRGRIIGPDPREDRAATLSLLARQGYRAVFVDWSFAEVVSGVAARFPRTRFVLIDRLPDAAGRRLRNLTFLTIRTHEASYLAGWLAAKLEQRRAGRDVVGVVGGFRIPPVEDFVIGFSAGARSAAPRITVLTQYSRDFGDPAKCKAIAGSQIARGAGVVLNVAGSCGIGTLDAARDGGAWGIGVDVDQSSLGPHILTSVVKHYDVAFAAALRRTATGNAHPLMRLVLRLRDGAAGLARISPTVPADLRDELRTLRARIVAGKIRVPGAPV